ncbi:uncharacterized protein Z518_09440 [Rhinocladiella mackenziei CBS 650.93]|uniref:Transcription factor domain-containing protein n=1 Tax=Rhinocladiella mackenziei CBS 650.93 TaxID=1442369 RepID=A0A0D2I7A2_9EURO|nr:uncharacterized protein Z518_09440 [Rhinocladiella mackenziei CBS 650.93]KIX01714.1 hypothetical protein Z518_09440 [Rhinocladiella mackenziei CBS 650.93]
MLENQNSYAVYNASCVNLFNGVTEPSKSRTDWDFSSTYDLFNLGNDIFTTTDTENTFLTSLPTLPSGEAESIPSPANSLVSRMNRSTSDAVYEAFQQSAGRWSPEKRHYRAAEESHLSLGRGAPTTIDCLGKWDPQIFSQNLLPSTRDQILAAIVRSCDQDNMAAAASAFPSAEVLDRLLKAFHTQHASLADSWIHIPTFQVTEARLELLIACISAAAAVSPSRPVQKFGLAMQEFLVFQLWSMSEKSNALIRDLQFLQAFALHLHVGLWSGIRRKMEMAGSFVGIITNSLRGSGRYRHAAYTQVAPRPEDDGDILEAKWKQWIHEESFKRLVYHMYMHCSQEALMTSGTSCMSYAELTIPWPQSQRLWFARSAQEWKALHLELRHTSPEKSPCLIDLLADPTKTKMIADFHDQSLIRLCLIYAVSSMVRRYRQDKSVFTSNGLSTTRVDILSDEVQHQVILHILNDIRASNDDYLSLPVEELIIHLLSMHVFAPFDQMELVAGKEGRAEVQRVYPCLQRWIRTRHARQAVWHASQVLRSLRELPHGQLSNFYAIAAYHAGLCLWLYGVLLQEMDTKHSDAFLCSPNDVILDGDESIQSQRWINHNRGRPVISTGRPDDRDGAYDRFTVPIHSPQALVQILLRSAMSRFMGMNSPLVDNICHLMQALGNIYETPDDGPPQTLRGDLFYADPVLDAVTFISLHRASSETRTIILDDVHQVLLTLISRPSAQCAILLTNGDLQDVRLIRPPKK